ncbi:MAG: BatD family protein [Sulfurovaceae bacterium]|nr:BatD family protein [Sulfurovaceae bacterium]
MMQNLGKIFILFLFFVSFSNANASIEMIAGKKSLNLGESLVVSVIITKSADIDRQSIKYIQPSFDGFISKEISKKITLKRDAYEITQIDYLLIAQKPGNYIIDPANVTVVTKNNGLRRFFDLLFNRKPAVQKISSNMLSITIKPLLNSVQLVGDFNITTQLNTMNTKANMPVVLSLKISGIGAVDDFGGLDYNIDGITIYSKKPKITQNIIGTDIHSSYTKEYVFMGDHDFTIPSRNIMIYDTKTNKVETTIIPSYDIKVIDSKRSIVSRFIENYNSKENMPSKFWVGFLIGVFCMVFIWFAIYKRRNAK